MAKPMTPAATNDSPTDCCSSDQKGANEKKNEKGVPDMRSVEFFTPVMTGREVEEGELPQQEGQVQLPGRGGDIR